MNYKALNTKMVKLLKNCYPFIKRKFSNSDEVLLTQCLRERTLLQLSGNEASQYLQGLITNDMQHLQNGAPSMFTMFLNSKGRVLYDSIIYNTANENTFLIECDVGASSSLKQHLMMYKVRRKIKIECLKDKMEVWTVVGSKNLENVNEVFDYKNIITELQKNLQESLISQDPRLPCFGLRIITPKNFNFINEVQKKSLLKIQEENFYKTLRYKLGVGEGLQELPSEKCLPLEANGDYLHGISFHKGCYIGQELTARTYHTGVIRKRLMPLTFEKEMQINENGIPIFAVPESNKSIGKLQGIEQRNGVGLLRIEEALKADELVVLDAKCKTHRPFWWPTEAPKERMKIG